MFFLWKCVIQLQFASYSVFSFWRPLTSFNVNVNFIYIAHFKNISCCTGSWQKQTVKNYRTCNRIVQSHKSSLIRELWCLCFPIIDIYPRVNIKKSPFLQCFLMWKNILYFQEDVLLMVKGAWWYFTSLIYGPLLRFWHCHFYRLWLQRHLKSTSHCWLQY